MRERALFFVIEGEFMTLDETQHVYKSGAVLGSEQFLDGDPWSFDLISKSDEGIIGKFCYSSYIQLKEQQP